MLKFVIQVHAFCIAHFDIVVYNCCNCFNGYYVGLHEMCIRVNNLGVKRQQFQVFSN